MNTSFSTKLPTLQLAVDSTSLGAFKKCPRYYQLSIIEGYEPKARSHHLTFGLVYHGALERYDHRRFAGDSHDDALDFALAWALSSTWISDTHQPWNSGDSNKNRFTLVRSIVDYVDRFGESDSLTTVRLANGKPAVELSFSFFSGAHASTGEEFLFCGHLDRLVSLNDRFYVSDRKTTSQTISQQWFTRFSPNNQFSLYMLASQIILSKKTEGLIVDGAQIAVGFTRFERGIVSRSDDSLREWHADAILHLELMDRYARAGYWPQNDTACDMYGGCAFRTICSKSPANRQQWLDSEFSRREWDPLQRRGDI